MTTLNSTQQELAIATAQKNGRTAAENGALLVITEDGRTSMVSDSNFDCLADDLWKMEMAHGDWGNVLSVIDEDDAKWEYI